MWHQTIILIVTILFPDLIEVVGKYVVKLKYCEGRELLRF